MATMLHAPIFGYETDKDGASESFFLATYIVRSIEYTEIRCCEKNMIGEWSCLYERERERDRESGSYQNHDNDDAPADNDDVYVVSALALIRFMNNVFE